MFGGEFGDMYFRMLTQDGGDVQLTQLRDDPLTYDKWQKHTIDIPPCTEFFQVCIRNV